jgi:hypothetical protein
LPKQPLPLLPPTNEGMPARLRTIHHQQAASHSRRFLMLTLQCQHTLLRHAYVRTSDSSRRLSQARTQANPNPDAAKQQQAAVQHSNQSKISTYTPQKKATGSTSRTHPHEALCWLPCAAQSNKLASWIQQGSPKPGHLLCPPSKRQEPCVCLNKPTPMWPKATPTNCIVSGKLNSTDAALSQPHPSQLAPDTYRHATGHKQNPETQQNLPSKPHRAWRFRVCHR